MYSEVDYFQSKCVKGLKEQFHVLVAAA